MWTKPAVRAAGYAILASAFLFLSCNENSTLDPALNLSRYADSLSGFDSVRVVLETPDGEPIDTAFHGKVKGKSDLALLVVPHYDGGNAVISIVGYLDGRRVYDVDLLYNGGERKVESRRPRMLPGAAIRLMAGDTIISVGDSVPLPPPRIEPDDLAEKAHAWSVSDPGILAVDARFYRGIAPGEAQLTVRLVSDTAKKARIRVQVKPAAILPDSVTVSPDSLRLFVGGQASSLLGKIHPDSAGALRWVSGDSAVAHVDDSGRVEPRAQGTAYISAISAADGSKRDSCRVTVVRDVPVLNVGRDTAMVLGKSIVFSATAAQEYGSIVQYKWDLDGNGNWDDSADAIKPLSMTYGEAKAWTARFYARDGEGNDTLVTKRILVVIGPRVEIKEPLDKSYVNRTPIDIVWTVDGNLQASAGKQTLTEGPNVVSRSAKDSLGNSDTATITVYLDTHPPQKPVVKAPSRSASRLPAWTWSGGGGGDGRFRFRLDNESLEGMPETRDTVFRPIVDLAEGKHTLLVQERDEAGNWSPSGFADVIVDATAPAAPRVTAESEVTASRRPVWRWTGDSTGAGVFRVLVDANDFTQAYDTVSKAEYAPGRDLAEGFHFLFVQERDAAGNWSVSGSARVYIDLTAPDAPTVSVSPASPSRERKPVWSWRPGSSRGAGWFRWSLDSAALGSAKEDTATRFVPAQDLPEGLHGLYVQERDSAGNWSPPGKAAMRIDLTPPGRPTFSAGPSSPTNVRRPVWKWNGGAGGGGVFRFGMDSAAVDAAGEDTAKSYAPGADLPEGWAALYVRERDSAGNWSEMASFRIRIDLTPPNAPSVTVSPASPTRSRRPEWTWSTGGNGGIGRYRFSLDSTALASLAGDSILRFVPAQDLAEGWHVLYVQEKDSAGNFSAAGRCSLRVDLTPPNAPKVASDSVLTTNLRPTWKWTSGGGGAAMYRYSLDDSTFAGNIPEGPWTSFSPTSALSPGSHILYVRERDSAGNWSASGRLKIRTVGANGFAVGHSGLLMRTSDGGATWDWKRGGYNFRSARFIDANIGYVGSYYGTVLKTVNGGGKWTVLPNPGLLYLYGITCTDANTCYAFGQGLNSSTAIAKTVNGGNTWTLQSAGTTTSTYIIGLSCLDANACYAVGEGNKAWKTTNGGANWSPLTLPTATSMSLQDIHCTDTSTCTAVGYIYNYVSPTYTYYHCIRTTNGGANWAMLGGRTVGLGYLYKVQCIDANTCYASGGLDTVRKTTDGGATWTGQSTGTMQYLNNIHFRDANRGFAVGGMGTIAMTTNGGAAWTVISKAGGTEQALQFIQFTDQNTGYAVGPGGTILKTTNGGAAWTSDLGGASWDLYSLHFPEASTGYAAGASTIVKTVNSGQNWGPTGPVSQSIQSIFCTDANTCHAVGYGVILKSQNGGTSWNLVPGGISNTYLYSVVFPSLKNGIIVGSGWILTSGDGGASWSAQTSKTLYSVACPDADTCYAVGAAGTIVKSTNAGSTWSDQQSGTTQHLQSVSCVNTDTCLAVGYSGTILRTLDGGRTAWSPITSGVTASLYSVHFTNPNTGFIGGAGILMKTINGGASWTSQYGNPQGEIAIRSIYFP